LGGIALWRRAVIAAGVTIVAPGLTAPLGAAPLAAAAILSTRRGPRLAPAAALGAPLAAVAMIPGLRRSAHGERPAQDGGRGKHGDQASHRANLPQKTGPGRWVS
jgi:hypothetical protein